MKDVVGYEDYYWVGDAGEIWSLRKGAFLKTTEKPNGYKYIEFNVKGDVSYHRVHRLVAKAYIPNPENKPFVNHLDGDKGNNNVDNLEWVTGSENNKHAVDNGLARFVHNVYKVTDKYGECFECVGYTEVMQLCGISKNTVLKYSKLSGLKTKTGYLIERATTILQRSTAK